jgi:hypothetical protein
MSEQMTERDQGDSQYLVFERHDPTDRKTPVVFVLSKSSGVRLGVISWFGRWRQFCFFPSSETVFNVGCMNDILGEIAALMAERRADHDL